MLESKSIETGFALIKNDESKILDVTVGKHQVKPGMQIPKAEAQETPQVSFKSTSGTSYIVISLDIDAPFPSWDGLGPILHWNQSGFKSDPATGKLTTAAPFVANWIGPAPPPGSGPHRYIFLLYDEPAGFDPKKYAPPEGKKLGNWNRIRYNLGAFEKEVKLGPVLAFNYFRSN